MSAQTVAAGRVLRVRARCRPKRGGWRLPPNSLPRLVPPGGSCRVRSSWSSSRPNTTQISILQEESYYYHLMDAAYANVGLDANTTWRDGPGDCFQKCSDKLWVKLNYLKEKKHHQVGEKGNVVTVQDVIPQSRLTRYGNYRYDNDREMMYNREKPLHYPEELSVSGDVEGNHEPWMLIEVEHEFRKLTRNCSQPYDLYNGFKPIDCVEVEESIRKKYPVLAKKCQPSVIDPEETLETIHLPNPFYRIDDLNQLELQMRISSTKHIWEHPLRNQISVMSAQMINNNHQELRNVPFAQIEYQSDRNLFRMKQPQPLPLPQTAQLSSTSPFRCGEGNGDLSIKRFVRISSSRTTQLQESKTSILPVVKKKSNSDGNDFSNLTLLTRPINHHDSSAPERTTFEVPETVLKWLHTGYPTRSTEFQAIQTLNNELRSMRTSLQETNSSPGRAERNRNDNIQEKKLIETTTETVTNQFVDTLVRRTENLSVSHSSSSSSGHNRTDMNQARPIRSTGHNRKQQFANVTYSPVSAGSLPGGWKNQTSPIRSSRVNESLGRTSSESHQNHDGIMMRYKGKAKCRPILNTQYREVLEIENVTSETGTEKRRLFREMEVPGGLYLCYRDNCFDDLERQAIEQWPPDDSVETFHAKNFQ